MKTGFLHPVLWIIPVWGFLSPLADGQFVQQGPKLVGTDAIGQANQGASVALSADGNTAIIGAPGDNENLGAAWVFTRSSGTWTQQGPKLVGTSASLYRSYSQGASVALSADGNTAIVGGIGLSESGWETKLQRGCSRAMPAPGRSKARC
jgi:hypothetical protein